MILLKYNYYKLNVKKLRVAINVKYKFSTSSFIHFGCIKSLLFHFVCTVTVITMNVYIM